MLTKHLSDLWLGVGNLTFEGGGGCLKDFENKFPARPARQKKKNSCTDKSSTHPPPPKSYGPPLKQPLGWHHLLSVKWLCAFVMLSW